MVVIVLHLNNREANRRLELKIGDTPMANSECPRYLGIKIDRSVTFKDHIETMKKKLKSRNNIIQNIAKLVGASWGSIVELLQTSTLALVYSVAEYCVPVWSRSRKVKK